METFILGFKYVQKHRFKCQLINFLLGQAKMAIYVSRRNKIEQMSSDDMMMVFSILVRSRVLIDFNFYKAMKDLEPFKEIWCYSSVLCVCLKGISVICCGPSADSGLDQTDL